MRVQSLISPEISLIEQCRNKYTHTQEDGQRQQARNGNMTLKMNNRWANCN